MTRFPRGIRFVAILGVIALSGCDRRAPAPIDETPPEQPAGVVRCFPDGGSVAFTVNGVPVPEKTIERFADFYKDLGVANPDLAKATAIDQAILMIAAVYADLKGTPGRIEEWSSRVRAVEARLKAGEDFATVARTASDCPTRTAGGDLGEPFRRDQRIAPLSEVVFRQKVGEVSPPFVTIYGAEFVKVTKTVDGSSPGKDLRRASHVMVAFDPMVLGNKEAWDQKCLRLKTEAQVESVKEPYKKLIPTSYRR